MYGNDVAAPAAARLDRLLVRTASDVGAHVGAVYLVVPERQLLQMATEVGAPVGLVDPWTRMALAAPAPVCDAFRTRRPVWIPGQEDFARRYPRIALAFPYSVAQYDVPLIADGKAWGTLMLLWPGSRPNGLSPAERGRVADGVDEMATVLRDAAARGLPVSPPAEPHVLDAQRAPEARTAAAALLERLTEGFVALDVQGRMTFLTQRAAQLLDRDRIELQDAEPWDALPWLSDPVYENAFVAALFSREPTAFSARRPDGVWLSFVLFPDATGISVRITQGDGPHRSPELTEEDAALQPARAGTLFHLLHLASALAEATGVEEVSKSLMGQMRRALGAQGLALLISKEGRERVVGSRGFPPEMPEYFNNQPMAVRSEGTRAMNSGVAGFHPTNEQLVSTYPEHRHYRDMAAFAFLPLTISGGTFGCLVLGYDRPHPFTPDERAELTSLAGMIAQALERARLYDANARVARGLQDGLLPRHLPRIPRLRAEARYRPATNALDVGGDFYDLIDFGEHGAGAVIGDVQGHSVQAAALMGQIRTAVHSQARAGAPPEEILARTNRLLLELNSDLFCSCLYAHIDMAGDRVLLASAGHPPPILRSSTHRAEALDLPPGLLLGVEADTRFQTVEVPMAPGSLLALYTDGLIERPGVDLGTSIDALADHLARAGDERLDLLADAIVDEAQRTAVPKNSDDIALLLLGCDDRLDEPGPAAR